MPDIFALLKAADDAPTLENRTLLLDRMEATYAQFTESFPGNQRFPAQLSAVRHAKQDLLTLAEAGTVAPEALEQVFSVVKHAFLNAGATDTDLQQWGIG